MRSFFILSPEVEPLAGGDWGGSHRPLLPMLCRAKPRGILLYPGRHAEHRAHFRCGSLSCGVMEPEWSLRNGAKITSQVSAGGRAESSPFQGGVRHGGIDAGKFLQRVKLSELHDDGLLKFKGGPHELSHYLPLASARGHNVSKLFKCRLAIILYSQIYCH